MVVLVVPEAAAAVVLYLSMARWRRREALALAVVLITGLVALLSIFLLALTEVRRERWGAAYLRSSLLVYLTATTGDCVGRTGPHECPSPGLRGSVLLLSASLIIVARKGYHPRTLTAILRENCRDIEAFFLIIREVTPLSWQPPFGPPWALLDVPLTGSECLKNATRKPPILRQVSGTLRTGQAQGQAPLPAALRERGRIKGSGSPYTRIQRWNRI